MCHPAVAFGYYIGYLGARMEAVQEKPIWRSRTLKIFPEKTKGSTHVQNWNSQPPGLNSEEVGPAKAG